ncbi:MAG: hypothetical protein AABW50_01330 [Nanoarchaeota archaeon]
MAKLLYIIKQGDSPKDRYKGKRSGESMSQSEIESMSKALECAYEIAREIREASIVSPSKMREPFQI